MWYSTVQYTYLLNMFVYIVHTFPRSWGPGKPHIGENILSISLGIFHYISFYSGAAPSDNTYLAYCTARIMLDHSVDCKRIINIFKGTHSLHPVQTFPE